MDIGSCIKTWNLLIIRENKIEYLYDANGVKLSKRVIKNGSLTYDSPRDYVGDFVYAGQDRLGLILTLEGVVDVKASQYQYYLKDHLGNTRVMFTKVGNKVETLQENHYYPFGMRFARGNFIANDNRYLYNGKELQDDGFEVKQLPSGEFRYLDWYDYGARFFDVQLARWHVVDPMANQRLWVSPYNFLQNNPINSIDPTGALDWEPNQDGNLIAESGDNAQSLADHQGISYSEALKQLTDQGYTVDSKGILDLNVGDKVELNNVYTESIENSTSDYTFDNAIAGTSTTGTTPEDYYNCWGAAIAGSQDQKIKVGVGISEGSTFDAKLSSDYKPTTESNAKFGKTVLRFADAFGVQHGAGYPPLK